MNMFGSLFKLLNRDLTGSTWQEEHAHPYFENLIYFGSKKAGQSYWEAEVPLARGDNERVGVTMTGERTGPTEAEVTFCQSVAWDLDALFERCREAFAHEFQEWTKEPMPEDWRTAFQLVGFEIPVGGNPLNKWEVCYFVEATGHYFTAVFENGTVLHVAVNG
jgi:hypothetical protein